MPVQGNLPRFESILNHLDTIARLGNILQPQDFHRSRRRSFQHRAPMVIKQGAYLAVNRAHNERVADSQGAILDQHRRHGAAPAVQFGFQNRPAGQALGVGLQSLHFGDEQNHFQQQVEVLALLGRNLHRHGLPAPFFRHQIKVGQLPLDAFRLGVGLVDLIDGHHDRHFGGPRVIDGFERLRHDAVIRRDHQHHDIRDPSAARAHQGEGFVAGSIDKGYLSSLPLHLICADALRNAPRFVRRHIGFAQSIQKRGFAVIDVAHHRDHRSARSQVFRAIRLLNFLQELPPRS